MKKWKNSIKGGIEKLNDKGEEVTEKIDDLVQVKDELVKMSKDYDTFTGKNSNMDGTVKFIMKTNEIKVQEQEDNKEEKQEESGRFINWIKNLISNIFN